MQIDNKESNMETLSELVVNGFLTDNQKAELTLKALRLGSSLSFTEYGETTVVSAIS